MSARGAARRGELLDAAMAVVAHSGSSALTHRAVAATARVSLASITYHFSSIEELRRLTFQQALSVLDEELSRAVSAHGGTTERMPTVFAEYLVALLTRYRPAVVTVNEMAVAASHDEHLAPTFHAYQGHLAGLLGPCVGGKEAGLMAAAALQGLLLSAVTYGRPGPSAGDEAARWRAVVVDLITRLRR